MYQLFRVISVLAAVALAALGFAQKADSAELARHSQLIARLVAWLQLQVWVLVPALTGVLVLSQLIAKHLGEPWVKSAIHSLLGEIQQATFVGEDNPEAAYDRVTLFRRKPFHFCLRCWPWTGWLVPVHRSGHTSQKTSILFRAPDRPSDAEGIAGYCWANRKLVEINGLPELSNSSSEDDIKTYSESTRMSADWVRRNLPQARAYFAFPVNVKGKPWGVIVVDSRSERIIGSRVKSLITIVGTVLSDLAERS